MENKTIMIHKNAWKILDAAQGRHACRRDEALDAWEQKHGAAYPGDIVSEVLCDCDACNERATQGMNT